MVKATLKRQERTKGMGRATNEVTEIGKLDGESHNEDTGTGKI
jgi:hypothetical protein